MEGDHRATAGDQVSSITDQEVLGIRKVELVLQVQGGFLAFRISMNHLCTLASHQKHETCSRPGGRGFVKKRTW